MKLPKDLQLEGEAAIFQKPNTAFIPMITGTLSAFCSYLVIRELWPARSSSSSRGRSNMRAPIVRVLLGISITDLLMAIAFGLGTIPSPRWLTNVPYAMGNYATCDAQGFFLQFANTAGAWYIALLTFMYLVVIKYHWTDAQIHTVEVWAHSLILISSLVFSIFPIPMEFYNNTYHMCFFGAYPYGCEEKTNVPCERGAGFAPYFEFFSVFPFWPCLIASSIMMVMVYQEVRRMESKTNREQVVYQKSTTLASGSSSTIQEEDDGDNENKLLSPESEVQDTGNSQGSVGDDKSNDRTADTASLTSDSTHSVNRNRSRTVAVQCLMFFLAFVLENILNWILIVRFAFTHSLNPALTVWTADVMKPLQGFFNAIVLLRTSTLHTPEGKLIQRGFNGCWSLLDRVTWNVRSCCLHRRSQQASQPDDMEKEDSLPSSIFAHSEHKREAAASLYNDSSEKESFLGVHANNLNSQSRPGAVVELAELRNHYQDTRPPASKTKSLDIHGQSNLFNSSNLQNISSSDPCDSLVEMEQAAMAALGQHQILDLEVPGMEDANGSNNNQQPHARMPSSAHLVSDLTADSTTEQQQQLFSDLVVDDNVASRLADLYKESVNIHNNHNDEKEQDSSNTDSTSHSNSSQPLYNDDSTVI